MELVLLMGIPGSGKSSFYKRYFFHTHVRISLDLLNTRRKEQQFMKLAFVLEQRMVIDNTNVTRAERSYYIREAKQNRFKVTGYFMESNLSACLARNEKRTGKEKISKIGIIAKYRTLEIPSLTEGFDRLFYVTLKDDFVVDEWKNDKIPSF